MTAYLGLPLWGQYLLQGVLVFITLAAGAVVLGRAGRSPYFSLLLTLPFVQIVAIWVFAFAKWPKRG